MATGYKKTNLFNIKNKNLIKAQTKKSSSSNSDLILSSSYMSFNDLAYEKSDYVSNNDHLTKDKRKHFNQYNRQTEEILASESTHANTLENQNNSIEIMNDLPLNKFKKFKSSRASSSASISSQSSTSSTSSKSNSSFLNGKLIASSSNQNKDLLKVSYSSSSGSSTMSSPSTTSTSNDLFQTSSKLLDLKRKKLKLNTFYRLADESLERDDEIEANKLKSSHVHKFFKNFKTYLTTLPCDLALVLDNNQAYYAHKIVLINSSDYFNRILTVSKSAAESASSNLEVVRLKNVDDSDSVLTCIDYMYSGGTKLNMRLNNLDSIRKTAYLFELNDLVELCDQLACKSNNKQIKMDKSQSSYDTNIHNNFNLLNYSLNNPTIDNTPLLFDNKMLIEHLKQNPNQFSTLAQYSNLNFSSNSQLNIPHGQQILPNNYLLNNSAFTPRNTGNASQSSSILYDTNVKPGPAFSFNTNNSNEIQSFLANFNKSSTELINLLTKQKFIDEKETYSYSSNKPDKDLLKKEDIKKSNDNIDAGIQKTMYKEKGLNQVINYEGRLLYDDVYVSNKAKEYLKKIFEQSNRAHNIEIDSFGPEFSIKNRYIYPSLLQSIKSSSLKTYLDSFLEHYTLVNLNKEFNYSFEINEDEKICHRNSLLIFSLSIDDGENSVIKFNNYIILTKFYFADFNVLKDDIRSNLDKFLNNYIVKQLENDMCGLDLKENEYSLSTTISKVAYIKKPSNCKTIKLEHIKSSSECYRAIVEYSKPNEKKEKPFVFLTCNASVNLSKV